MSASAVLVRIRAVSQRELEKIEINVNRQPQSEVDRLLKAGRLLTAHTHIRNLYPWGTT